MTHIEASKFQPGDRVEVRWHKAGLNPVWRGTKNGVVERHAIVRYNGTESNMYYVLVRLDDKIHNYKELDGHSWYVDKIKDIKLIEYIKK